MLIVIWRPNLKVSTWGDTIVMDMEFMACAFVNCVNISFSRNRKEDNLFVYVPIHYQEVYDKIIIVLHS